jgi:hypothetical protein
MRLTKASVLKKAANSDVVRSEIPGAAEPTRLSRHAAKCRVCSHPRRDEIEADFIQWDSLATIVREYGLGNRSTVYRHALALNLTAKRRRNIRVVLDKFIEQTDAVHPSAAAIIAAVEMSAKLNARGEWIEPDEHLELQDLFDRMTPEEKGAYAKDGKLPTWFRKAIAAVGGKIPEGGRND